MRIPEYDPKVKPPPGLQAPTIAPDTAGMAFRGLAQVGSAVADLGQQIQEQKDNIARTEELTTRITGAEKDLADLMRDLDVEHNPETAEWRFSDGFNAIRDRWMEGVNDSKVLNALTQHFGNREYQESVNVKHKSLQWTIERGQAKVIEGIDSHIKMGNLDLAYELLDNAEATGLYSPDKVATLKQKTRQEFYVHWYNQMIQDDPEMAIRNFAWLKQIGDPEKENALLQNAVTWANRMASMQEKEFRERSGSVLNQMIISVNMGRLDRPGVNALVGSGVLTDEHERILLDQIDAYEKAGPRSDPNRLGWWQAQVEIADMRKDIDALKSYEARIRGDNAIVGADKATLLATIGTKLKRLEGGSDSLNASYREAINVIDAYCEYDNVFRQFKSQAKKALHASLIEQVQDAAFGRRRLPSGKYERIEPLSGFGLIRYARDLVEEARDKEAAQKAQANQQEQFRIPTDNTSRRGK